MRLLVINWFDWTHPLWGGAEVYLREVFCRLAARGHQVTLLCSSYAGGRPDSVEEGVRILRRGWFWTFHLQVPWLYRRHLAAERWDCVFEYTNKVPMLTPLYVRAPLVAVAHHLFGATIFHASAPPVAAYAYLMERLLPLFYRRTPWIAVSASTRADLIRRGIPRERIHIVPNGIDSTFFAPPAPPHALAAGSTIAWIGRLRRYKRVDVLLRALPLVREQVPEATLEVAGEGPERARLEALAAKLGLGASARFLGGLSELEKRALLQRAAVLAQPSIKEGWGLTILEAGACGVPAVASDVAGLRESVRQGETGLLVPPGDPAALAGALVALLRDPARRRAMGAAARRWAQQFDWEAAASATERLAAAAAAGSAPHWLGRPEPSAGRATVR